MSLNLPDFDNPPKGGFMLDAVLQQIVLAVRELERRQSKMSNRVTKATRKAGS